MTELRDRRKWVCPHCGREVTEQLIAARDKRNAIIIEAVRTGATLKEAAARVGVSAPTASKVCANAGVEPNYRWPPNPTAERNTAIWQARTAGEKYRVIAERYGISIGRVRQIVQQEERDHCEWNAEKMEWESYLP